MERMRHVRESTIPQGAALTRAELRERHRLNSDVAWAAHVIGRHVASFLLRCIALCIVKPCFAQASVYVVLILVL